MDANNERKIDEVASDLDDLTTTVEELEMDPAVGAGSSEMKKLREALQDASVAADAAGDQLSDSTDDASGDG